MAPQAGSLATNTKECFSGANQNLKKPILLEDIKSSALELYQKRIQDSMRAVYKGKPPQKMVSAFGNIKYAIRKEFDTIIRLKSDASTMHELRKVSGKLRTAIERCLDPEKGAAKSATNKESSPFLAILWELFDEICREVKLQAEKSIVAPTIPIGAASLPPPSLLLPQDLVSSLSDGSGEATLSEHTTLLSVAAAPTAAQIAKMVAADAAEKQPPSFNHISDSTIATLEPGELCALFDAAIEGAGGIATNMNGVTKWLTAHSPGLKPEVFSGYFIRRSHYAIAAVILSDIDHDQDYKTSFGRNCREKIALLLVFDTLRRRCENGVMMVSFGELLCTLDLTGEYARCSALAVRRDDAQKKGAARRKPRKEAEAMPSFGTVDDTNPQYRDALAGTVLADPAPNPMPAPGPVAEAIESISVSSVPSAPLLEQVPAPAVVTVESTMTAQEVMQQGDMVSQLLQRTNRFVCLARRKNVTVEELLAACDQIVRPLPPSR